MPPKDKKDKGAPLDSVSDYETPEDVPVHARLLAPGTVLHLNGVPVSLFEDVHVTAAGFENEQHFAAVLAADPKNLALNADSLRLRYNPMNGTPLPLEDQKLKPEEMNDAERAYFNVKDEPDKSDQPA